MLLGGTVGSILGGYLALRFGSRRVIAGSLAASSVCFVTLVAAGEGSWTVAVATLGGGLLLMSFALAVVVAQEMLPDHRAYAAGLTFGLGSGLSSFGLGLTGWLAEAERLGVPTMVVFLTLLPLVGAGIMLAAPKPAPAES